MRHVAFLIVASALAVVIVAAQAGQASSTQSPYRAMHRKDHPLAELIKPGTDALTVEKDQFPPMLIDPPKGVSELEWLTKIAPAAAIVTVDAVSSHLTPTKDWIESEVHGTVDQLLKYDPSLTQGHAMTFAEDGGQMTINGTKVTAVLYYADGFQPHRRYLVFPSPTATTDTVIVNPMVSYLIDPTDHLIPLATEGRATSERGVSLDTAISRIKAALKILP
jgi:hypothetical protein